MPNCGTQSNMRLWLVCLLGLIALSHGQDFSKVSKLRERMEDYRNMLTKEQHVRMNATMARLFALFGSSALQPIMDHEPIDSLAPVPSNSCLTGWEHLNKTHRTNALNLTFPQVLYALDAWGKPGAGMLEGNFYAWGSYDECLELDHTKYCIVPIIVTSGISTGATLSLGTCFPTECNDTDIVLIIDSGITGFNYFVTSDDIICEDGDYEYDAGAITMIVVASIFAALVLLSTVTDWAITNLPAVIASTKTFKTNPTNDTLDDLSEKSPLLTRRYESQCPAVTGVQKVSILTELITSFSLYKVIPQLLSTSQPSSAISSINGIRVLSMFWVILGHTHLWALFEGNTNIAHILGDVIPRFTFQAIENATFSVDSFFFLSGLLMAYLTLRQMSRKNGRFPIISFYVHRYLRLTPTYMFVLFFFWNMTVHLTNGPKYYDATGPGSDLVSHCKSYWWTNMLYINNFHPWEENKECIAWTWYLSNDMQFFVISPLMVVLLYYSLPIGLIAVCIILLGSFTSTAAIAGYYGFDATLFANESSLPVQSGDEIYIKPYARISPYLVGIVLGYLLYKKIRIPFNTFFNWVVNLNMLALAGILLAVPLYGLYNTQHGHHLSDVDNIFYFTFSRFTWSLGLAFLVFACHNGYGGVINSFLSMKFWIPLGRLTFTAYLVHPTVLLVVFGALRTPIYYEDITMAVYAVGCIVLSYGAAGVIATFVEFPISNLEAVIFKVLGLGARESTRQGTQPTNT